MSLFTRIGPLLNGESIVDGSGRPSLRFQRLWQSLFTNGEFTQKAAETAQTTADGKQDADPDLESISNLSGTGIAVRSAVDTWTLRTLQAGAGISITNGDGVAGDPTIASTVTGFTDEAAQDAVGSILTDTSTIDFTYDDVTPKITADVKAGSIGPTQLANTTVAAGTYGDSTHTLTATIDAQGRVTAISTNAISGGSGGSWIPAVTGADPAELVTDGAGNLILVAGP